MITRLLFSICDWAGESYGRFWIRDLVMLVPSVENHFWYERSRMFDRAKEKSADLWRNMVGDDSEPPSVSFTPIWYVPE